MRILMLGAGNVGAALGLAWLARGHDVRFGVPDPGDPKYAALPSELMQPADARHGAEAIVLAVPYEAARPALTALGDLGGAVVLDATNPLAMGPDGFHLVVGHDRSGAEEIAAVAPGAFVFKALNQTGWDNMGRAGAYHPPPAMFVAGDDAAHKPVAMALVSELGFEAIDAGPLRAARLLEPLAMLWIELALLRGQGRDFAFAVVRHPDPASRAPGSGETPAS